MTVYKILYFTVYFVFKRSLSICHIIPGHFLVGTHRFLALIFLYTLKRIQWGHSKSTFLVELRGEVLKKRMITNRRRGFKPIYTLCEKNALFSKQQTEFFLISFLAVAKAFPVFSIVQHIKVILFLLKRRRNLFYHLAFCYEHKTIFIVAIYITM